MGWSCPPPLPPLSTVVVDVAVVGVLMLRLMVVVIAVGIVSYSLSDCVS